MTTGSNERSLRAIKLAHTLIWVFFVVCIAAIPISASTGRLATAAALIGIVFLEVLVLAFNGWRCPLTDVAGRYTEQRRDNFDIYLPEWLARHNKIIFGMLYVTGVVVTIAKWLEGAPVP